MLYYTVAPGVEDEIVADISLAGESVRAWPATDDGIEAFSAWLTGIVSFGEAIKAGEWSMYQFQAPSPLALPVNLSLNYVDLTNASRLGPDDFRDAVKWLSRFDSGFLINAQYEDDGRWGSGASGKELIKVLSDVVASLGPVVHNPQDENQDMRLQCVLTAPLALTRVSVGGIIDPQRRAKFLADPRVIGRLEISDIADNIDDEPDDPADWWR